ncbi:YbbR-like protein [Dokdonia sp. Hel_I_63]|uniref:CdaR family protein n=1 Tax=unclassified Dokdonia TaxID=2615033 RepID=UPI00020A662F|nr:MULTISPECIES: CdaR family protein [unclassified Dokdonia]AEE18404.1 hypothetical protein Krodi_0418 [Dokdonia sp. 4H-3-7-5]TVZ22364.1 YbbR-like protein [Dokdonia sp. Hel_I_63]
MFKGIKINSVTAREFLFFLLLTTIVAALIKLSKTYSTQYEVTLSITEVPIDRTVQVIVPEIIKIQAEGSGFTLFTSALDSPEIAISYEQLQRVSNREFTFNTNENQEIIKNAIDRELSILAMTPSQITVTIDSVASKKVPVISKASLIYKTGYGGRNKMIINPDSVTVVGPSSLLANIEAIPTEQKEITNINTDLSDNVLLSLDKLPEELRVSHKSIMLHQEIAKFTEGKITVPITVLNDPKKRVKILPKTAEIIYLVELENFESITPSDFLVTCDYATANNSDAYLTLTIAREPKGVKSVRLINKQVKFIIVN